MVQTETETEEVSIYAEADATLGSTGCVLLHSPFISLILDAWRAIMIFRRFLNILRHITVHRIL